MDEVNPMENVKDLLSLYKMLLSFIDVGNRKNQIPKVFHMELEASIL